MSSRGVMGGRPPGASTAPSSSAAVGLPDLGLGGSTVIVTGAGSGIGAAAARHLGAAGASVVLVGRRMALLETVAGAITSGGRPAPLFPAAPPPRGQPAPHPRRLPGPIRPDRRPGEQRSRRPPPAAERVGGER